MTGWRRTAPGLLIAAVYFFAVFATREGVGFTRDEGYYFRAMKDYSRWFEEGWKSVKEGKLSAPFSDESIKRHWRYNSEHPALVKTLFVFGKKIFHDWTGLLDVASSCRIVGMLFAALAVFLTYMLGLRFAGMKAGAAAAVFLALTPRFFFDAHLACFDVPIAAMWLLMVYAFHRAMQHRTWAWLCGPVFGLALATKHNAFFLPAILLTYYTYWRFDRYGWSMRSLVRPFPWVFVSMALLAPLVYFAHWPWLWHDTLRRFGGYLAFHLHHENYTTAYFGRMLYNPPFPWHFPFVMTAFTTEPPLLILYCAGVIALFYRFARPQAEPRVEKPEALYLLLNAFIPIGLFAFTTTPVFGGVKHWFPSMPFFCIGAGLALEHACRAAGGSTRSAAAYAGLALLAVAPSLAGIIHTHPYELSYYSTTAGGVRGAAAMGFQRQYWGYANAGVNDWLNRNAKRNALVYLHNTNQDAFSQYQQDELLRRDLRYAWDYKTADIAVFHYMHEFADVENGIIRYMHAPKPATGIYIDEVPIINVYVRH